LIDFAGKAGLLLRFQGGDLQLLDPSRNGPQLLHGAFDSPQYHRRLVGLALFAEQAAGQAAGLVFLIEVDHGALLLLPGDLDEDRPGALGIAPAIAANLMGKAVQGQDIRHRLTALADDRRGLIVGIVRALHNCGKMVRKRQIKCFSPLRD